MVGSYARDRPDSSNMVMESSSSKSASSSPLRETISIGGLPLSDLDGVESSTGTPFAGIAASASSKLFLRASFEDEVGSWVAPVGEGDGADDEGIGSSGRDGVRTFMVTRLERGSEAGSTAICCRSGVMGLAGSESMFMAESLLETGADVPPGEPEEESGVSTERLRDPLAKDVRRRFLATLLSSKGLGRVEQGSEETARSLDGSAVGA